MNNTKINTKLNLIGNADHKNFLELQTAYGIAQRGGSALASYRHAKRISEDVNLLSSHELKNLVFNENVFSN